MTIFKNYLERLLQINTDADNAQSGASDLSAYVGEIIGLEATTGHIEIQATGDFQNVNVAATGAINVSAIQSINISTSDAIYFSQGAGPEVPASPTVQDVVTALVNMGLITQAT